MPVASRPFTVRHVQLARALLLAIAALMITFSSDHSAAIGLAVFGGFGISTGLVLAVAAFTVYQAGRRWPYVIMSAFSFLFGMAGSIPSLRSDGLFFVLVIGWTLTTGLVELIAGIRSRGTEGARDSMVVGSLGLLLAVLLAVVPAGFVQQYTTPQGQVTALTGIIIGVGLFGGYAAIAAVYLGIAGLTPKPKDADTRGQTQAGPDGLADQGGYA